MIWRPATRTIGHFSSEAIFTANLLTGEKHPELNIFTTGNNMKT